MAIWRMETAVGWFEVAHNWELHTSPWYVVFANREAVTEHSPRLQRSRYLWVGGAENTANPNGGSHGGCQEQLAEPGQARAGRTLMAAGKYSQWAQPTLRLADDRDSGRMGAETGWGVAVQTETTALLESQRWHPSSLE